MSNTTRDGAVLTVDEVAELQQELLHVLMRARLGKHLASVDSLVISHRTLAAQLAAANDNNGRLENNLRAIRHSYDFANAWAEALESFVSELTREHHNNPRTVAYVESLPESQRTYSLDYWKGYQAALEWAVDDLAPEFGIVATPEPQDAGGGEK